LKIAVTGGTGFIGSQLIPALLMNGHEIVCAVEPGTGEGRDGVKESPADIRTGEGIPEALSDADAVVHLAGRNHVLKETAVDPLAEYRQANVEGTRNVARAASLGDVKVFVHMSSVKAMGEESDRVDDETSPCLPKTPYGISKLESEEVVKGEVSNCGMRVVIFRLPMVYGPGNKGNLPRMIRWADRGLPFPLFQPDNLRSMVYVGNVVAGVIAILKAPPAGVSTYILKDGEDYSTRRIYSAICRELGKRPRFLPVPSAVVKVGGLISGDFRKVAGSFRVSSAKIEREIGFTPPFSLEEGIMRTVRWYKRSAR
jgi:nucleoside-diphosphate-sugar epimerase